MIKVRLRFDKKLNPRFFDISLDHDTTRDSEYNELNPLYVQNLIEICLSIALHSPTCAYDA